MNLSYLKLYIDWIVFFYFIFSCYLVLVFFPFFGPWEIIKINISSIIYSFHLGYYKL